MFIAVLFIITPNQKQPDVFLMGKQINDGTSIQWITIQQQKGINYYYYYLNKFICLIYFWLRWVLVAARRFSLVAVRGAPLRCSARVSHCGGFSCCGARALGVRASVVVACRLSSCGSRALERRLSSCGAWAQLLHGMWDLLAQGSNPCPLHWQVGS